ncbi:protein of unknown function (plasmid) [Cupriavidus neocaledonicus]|uniref:Uncharacterized protein n=1 Tax=Cupriavidus neocaledonicus TaxID=1040979 RepID=A0A375HPN0_9BURK|nr:hypothetical protein CBM2605_B110052 [Cupriavidus neocaledonicus]SPD59832.1 protein of unknown function [Cupriavidus neocaledonicus]
MAITLNGASRPGTTWVLAQESIQTVCSCPNPRDPNPAPELAFYVK